MIAEILAVGTELLLGDIANTNAQFLSRELAKLGVNVYGHSVVGDNPARLMAAYRHAFEKAELVIATGGLGPTEDDITKETAADFFGVPLELHEESWAAIQKHFEGRTLPSNNRKQAMLPKGCTVFANHNGTAPGVCMERDGKLLILLPGPPNELEPMFLTHAVPFLRQKSGGVFLSRTLKITGVGESLAEELLKDILETQTNPTAALYAKVSEVWLRLTAAAPDEERARALIAPTAEAVYAKLGNHVYGEDDDTLPGVVAEKLRAKGLTLVTAESCTGGMLASTLVGVPGVSAVFREGLVTYANEAKINRLGVSEAILREHGAVSPQTAAAMAEGAAKTSGAAVGLSTTGIAGPDGAGGVSSKPVGLVYIGLYIEGRGVSVQELRLAGNREKIRRRAVVSALDYLRREL